MGAGQMGKRPACVAPRRGLLARAQADEIGSVSRGCASVDRHNTASWNSPREDTARPQRVVPEARELKEGHMGFARAVGEMDPQHLSRSDSQYREVIPRLRRDHVRTDGLSAASRRHAPAVARERHPLRPRLRLHPSRGRALLMKPRRGCPRRPRPGCRERRRHDAQGGR